MGFLFSASVNIVVQRRSHTRGPYKGRTDYSYEWKLKRGLPITDEDRDKRRVANSDRNRKFRIKALATVEGRAKRLWYDAKTRAEEYGVPFDITREWIEAKLRDGKCEMTGVELEFSHPTNSRVNKNAPSLDRIDPSQGYVRENVRVTTWMFNRAKNENTDADMLEFATRLLEHHGQLRRDT
jgi:hypothetical protein